MLDFQRKKDTNILGGITYRENSIFGDQSKTIYDYVLKHDSQIKEIQSEMFNFKSQLIELAMKSSFTQNTNNSINLINSSENNGLFLSQIKKFKTEMKNEIMISLNEMLNTNKKDLKEQIENLKGDFESVIEERKNNKKLSEINHSLENINQKLIINSEEKNNLENTILNKVNCHKIELNNATENIIKRIDNFDMDFDRLIQSLKSQFLEINQSINQLELSKLNINDNEKQMEIINKNIEELNSKMEIILNQQNKNINNMSSKNINNFNKNLIYNEDDIGIKQELMIFKNDLYSDIEKINLKILNELKNQADDIKLLYQDLHNLELKTDKNTNLNNTNTQINPNLCTPNRNILKIFDNKEKNQNQNISNNIISYIDSELSKKANLDQLNFALETQAKLNEAFSSASRISRFCWDSDGTLKDEKYIKWSIQNINTALDVFQWEKNSENITILQNGVYKIVFGLIGLDTKKNFGIIFNDDENVILDSTKDIEKENNNDISNDKGNIKFMERFIACVENTCIKAILFNNNDNTDNSEEAFLEITKII